LFKQFLSRNEKDLHYYAKNLKNEYLDQNAEDKTANSFTDLWDVQVTNEGSIYLNTNDNKFNLPLNDLNYFITNKICTQNKHIIFLNSSDYDFIFEAESKNKKFGSKNDYYCLKNKPEY
jgi:hypothetical protein